MNVPCGVFFARAPGMPRPAGIWRGEPFTSTVRWACMWYTTCSLVSQRMPSTGCPAALVAVLASGGALGTGTPSGPVGPGAGAGLSVPSVLSEVSFDDTEPVPPWAAEPPEVAASVMPTAAPATITTAPIAPSQRHRRRRRASAALACAIFWRACCCLFLLLLDTAPFLLGPRGRWAEGGAGHGLATACVGSGERGAPRGLRSGPEQVVREHRGLGQRDEMAARQQVRGDAEPVGGQLPLEAGREEPVAGARYRPEWHRRPFAQVAHRPEPRGRLG